MRLVTFHDKAGRRRIGALAADGRIADLNAAYRLYLHEKRKNSDLQIADALVPDDMRLLFEGGDHSLDAAREALYYVIAHSRDAGPDGEPVFFERQDIQIKAPII